jgi:octopine/nopaline transport system permease protein
MDFELMSDAFPKLLSVVSTTLMLAFSSVVIGFFFAVPIAVMRLSKSWILSNFAYGFVYIIRSTPILVQIFLIYYGSGQFRSFFEQIGFWIFLKEAWFCAILSLTINTAAYSSEIIRGGIQSVSWGQIEAARSIGMSGFLLFRRGIFPVAVRQAIPAYGNELMLMVKATSLASTITIIEITGMAKKIIAATYKPIEVFLIAGAIYLAINFLISRVILLLERRLNHHLRRQQPEKRLKSNKIR